jgi:cytochrome b561
VIHLQNSSSRYGWMSMALHWSILAVLGVSIWYAYARGFIPREERDLRRAIMVLHFDWSWIAFALVGLRILWKAITPSPQDINQDPRLILAHKLVTGALAWMPVLLVLSGVAAVWAAGRDVQAFGVTLLKGVAERTEFMHDATEIAHVGLWYLFGALLALHVGAALWHHAVKKDVTLRRMMPWGKVD